jgi:hypothetical protein
VKKLVIVLLSLMCLGLSKGYADTFQLAGSSFTVQTIAVSTFQWTQVDSPQLSGRTSLEIYNLDASSSIYCTNNNIASSVLNVRNDQTPPLNARPIPPSVQGSTLEGKWSLSLSNFASNKGAYPVSASMPVYCVSTRPASSGILWSTAAVTQSY